MNYYTIWFASGHRPGDMALQMELFDAVFEERNVLGASDPYNSYDILNIHHPD